MSLFRNKASITIEVEYSSLRQGAVVLRISPVSMDSQTQNTSLQRLQNVEKRVVRVLELAGGVMDELANPTGPRKEFINNHCREFMQLIKDIQVTLREEIKSACEYRPFEKCDYSSRISNEICCKKLDSSGTWVCLYNFALWKASSVLSINIERMKKLYRKGAVHPSPPNKLDQLTFLPAAILTLAAALSPEEKEVLAWDSSPNRQLIHEIIEAFEEWLVQSSNSSKKSRKDRKKKGSDSNSNRNKSSELKRSETSQKNELSESDLVIESISSGVEGGGGSNIGGDEGEGEGEEKGSVRKLMNFIGERIWGVWGSSI
ncbi:Mediator of RNA polymerase II transcription subunit 11 [Tripterygium wilfordii]|uniref:Mediator of RNA polymerase II transcription subunit 11 n=1 Tax=Tripterygium wilfordii TaxID=458696 RepID=A0A7J7D6Y3_TRIWF|nr:Mediator of RNA polymerase II transcription subunit 11 [Tripterygium wilfordii]